MTTKIMVVDDEPAIGKLLMYQLRGFGYEVVYVQNGLLALQRFTLEKPDLVLLDVMMPQVSGWEVCRQIRACSTVPVIMLTAKNGDPDVVTGLEVGADDYVTKPFSMVQLRARIEAVLRRAAQAPRRHGFTYPPARRAPHLATPALATGAPAGLGPVRSLPPVPSEVQAAAPADRSRPAAAPGVRSAPAPRRLGEQVREARLLRGLSLHQVERACKIRWEFLQAIEQENWAYVPRTQLGAALQTYTSYLGLDLRELLGRPAQAPRRSWFPLQLAACMAVVLVLVVVFYVL